MKFIFKNKGLRLIVLGGLSIFLFVFALSLAARYLIAPPIESQLDAETPKFSAEEAIQVQVLNACGVSGLAAKARDYLRKRGFDVVEIGNYKEYCDTSFVIDRVGDIKSARKTAYAMGINENSITTDIDSSMYLRCAVVIGKDYKTLKPFD